MSNLTYCQEYEIVGFVDVNEYPITTANGGDMVYVKLQGKDAYDGCSRLIKARVLEQNIDAQSPSSLGRVSVKAI